MIICIIGDQIVIEEIFFNLSIGFHVKLPLIYRDHFLKLIRSRLLPRGYLNSQIVQMRFQYREMSCSPEKQFKQTE